MANGESFRFLPSEINEDFQKLSKSEASQIVEIANESVQSWSEVGFKKFTLTDFAVPQNHNEAVNRILSSQNKDTINGETLSVAVQSLYRVTDYIYMADISVSPGNKTIRHYCDVSKRTIFRKDYSNGISFLEDVISRLRKLKGKQRLRVYYSGLESKYNVDGESSIGFDITKLQTPLRQIFPGEFQGFNSDAYSYIAQLGGLFCLHLDDYECNALNIVLYGGEKVWVVIRKEHKLKLRQAILDALGTSKICAWNHKNLFVDPTFFRLHNIDFCVVSQAVGDVMLIGNSVFHEGINYCGEKPIVLAWATNLLMNDWINGFEDFSNDIVTCGCTKASLNLTKDERDLIAERVAKLKSENQMLTPGETSSGKEVAVAKPTSMIAENVVKKIKVLLDDKK